MKNHQSKLFFVAAILALCVLPVFGQVTPTGSIAGTVTDPHGAVVPNATVTVKNKATGLESTATTVDNGTYKIPAVAAGVYTVTIEATSGFKKTQVTDVKVDVGTPTTVNVILEVGGKQETVTVVGGGELVQTQTATIGTTLTGRQITDIPTASRDALDLVLALPGTTTPGRPRTSSVNGLPKGALNITIDGINVQDNLLKSNDGFFTYIRPRTDAISEVTVSTSNPGAESSGEGAFQIKFVTQGGGNKYHGGLYYYYRTPGLNSNYWFNNRDLPPDPLTGKAPRADIILHQPGGKIGGPISIPKLFNGKDKAFFFVNYEEFRLPEAFSRTRNILSAPAQSGIYQFFNSTFDPSTITGVGAGTTTCSGSGPSRVCSVNLYQVIANAKANSSFVNSNPGIVGALTTPDPTISSLLASIRSAIPASRTSGDPNVDQTTFINHGGQTRKFPTVRFDFNLGKRHHIENIWNYQYFTGLFDFLNGVDPAFPGFPNHGFQGSNRFSDSMAWRWTISNNLVNEARYGIVGGTVLFFSDVNSGQFTNQAPNGQPMSLPLSNFASGGFTLTNATVTTGPSRRNSPVREFSDNLNWIRGNHSFTFGATGTRVALWSRAQTVVPSSSFAITSLDQAPINAFSFLPSSTQQNGSAQLYGVLSGRMTAFNSNARLDEKTNQYSWLGASTQRAHSFEWGAFGQDNWRFRPNITLTFGLRYERQEPIQADNDAFSGVTYAGLFGESGVGNLFKPACTANPCVAGSVGALPADHSAYTLFGKGTKAYNPTGIFLPSFGFTYSPSFKTGFLRRLGGESGQTVFRGGFSMASVREGTNVFLNVVGSNPGALISTNRNLTLGNLPVGTYLRTGPFGPPSFTSSPTYPNFGLITDSVNAFDPNLKIGYVESWSFGVQREVKRDNVIEFRYTSNRGHRLWRQIDLNELNIIENGVLKEWQLAQQNLLANISANRCQTGLNPTANAGCQVNFAYFGPGTGTVPLPITLAYFSNSLADPTVAANYTAALFRNSNYYNTMNPLSPSPLGFGSLLAGTGFDNRRTPTGQACFGLTTSLNSSGNSVAGCTGTGLFPYNMFLVDPGKRGDPFLVNNTGQTWYDALTVEFRRRMAKGLLVQGSYTLGKTLSNLFSSNSNVFDQPLTLRNLWTKKGVSNFDIRHGFKTNFIYELPLGKGKTFFSNAGGLVDRLVGGWVFNGNVRVQSGSVFQLGNVQLVGMTAKELEQTIKPYRDPDGFIYVFPKDIRDNTIKAFNLGIVVTQATGQPSVATVAYTNGTPAGRFIAPAGYGNCAQAVAGQCGFGNLLLHGPRFTRFDLSLGKKIRFSENMNIELRVEMLNAFNNINFLVGSAANDVNGLGGFNAASFGRITNAYQDTSTTNDPGGRVGQLVFRFNF